MKKSILSLEGVEVLSKKQLRRVDGGLFYLSYSFAEVCTAVCADGSSVTVSMCSDSSLGCSTAGGSSSCSCKEGKGPLDPPRLTQSFS